MISPGCRVMAVVKSEAYGHGLREIAAKLDQLGVDWFGVGDVWEGKELREITSKPILLLEPTHPNELKIAATLRITPSISNIEALRAFANACAEIGEKRDFHINVNTGMNRHGCNPLQIPQLTEIAEASPVSISGLWTHFAASKIQSEEHSKQLQRFNNVVEQYLKANPSEEKKTIFHAGSSSDLAFPDTHFGMIRVGAAIYGIESSLANRLKPVMSIRTRVSHITEEPIGDQASYFPFDNQMLPKRLAAVDIGYFWGKSRSESDGSGQVLLNGKKCRVVKKIGMDVTLIDISELPDVKRWDIVTVLGVDKDQSISAFEIAKQSEQIPYEVVCSLGRTLNRKLID